MSDFGLLPSLALRTVSMISITTQQEWVLVRHPPPGGDLVAPELPLVALGEAADHDGDGQREDEDPAQRAQPADQLAQECP